MSILDNFLKSLRDKGVTVDLLCYNFDSRTVILLSDVGSFQFTGTARSNVQTLAGETGEEDEDYDEGGLFGKW